MTNVSIKHNKPSKKGTTSKSISSNVSKPRAPSVKNTEKTLVACEPNLRLPSPLTISQSQPVPYQSIIHPTKRSIVLSLLKRTDGASLIELMQETNWQRHSVRGFLSGTVKKKLGLSLISTISAEGLRRYKIIEQLQH